MPTGTPSMAVGFGEENPPWYDDGRKPSGSKNAVSLPPGSLQWHHQPLLVRDTICIESVVSLDLHDPLLQLGTLLKAQAIAVVHLEALCFRDLSRMFG